MHKFDTPAAVSAVLDIPAGRIQVIAAERADTTVEVRPANSGTGLGRIHNTLNNTEGAAAGLTIHATTVQGDITARSL